MELRYVALNTPSGGAQIETNGVALVDGAPEEVDDFMNHSVDVHRFKLQWSLSGEG